jgi:hemerythrin-like domain-containing protein
MTHTANQTLTDVNDMVVVHRAFRREFELLPKLVRAVRAGDTNRAGAIGNHARLLLAALHLHHTSEDALLWPKLVDRCPLDASLVHRMESQHEQVDQHTERAQQALGRWTAEARPAVTEELAATFDRLQDTLFEHLGEEEREILPLAARFLTQPEWDEIGQHGIATMTKAQLPLMFGMILEEATPEEAALLYATVPAPVRFLTKRVFLPKYRRYVRTVRRDA